ncbi:MAG: DUF559 domain-containing protein [Planctomycetaceae bacterium]|nr:DUF559 domain-containing protein [Planctomycetaceae bacterium]
MLLSFVGRLAKEKAALRYSSPRPASGRGAGGEGQHACLINPAFPHHDHHHETQSRQIDGEPHFTEEGREHDRVRDRFLQRSGYTVLRIPGYDVVRDDGSVMEKFRAAVRNAMSRESLESHNPSPPTPLPETGRGEDD